MSVAIGFGISFEYFNSGIVNNLSIPVLVQSKSNTSKTSITPTSWGITPISGNLLILMVASAGTFTTPTGWILDANASTVKNLGYYAFYRISDGSSNDTPSYTQAGAYTSVWSLLEFSGNLTFEIANSVSAISINQTTINSPLLTPSAGKILSVISLVGDGTDLTDNEDNALINITNGFVVATYKGFNGTVTAGTGQENITQTIVYKVLTVDGASSISTSGDSWDTVSIQFNNPGSVELIFSYI